MTTSFSRGPSLTRPRGCPDRFHPGARWKLGVQRHGPVDLPVVLEEGDRVDALGREVRPDLSDPRLGVGLAGEALAGEVALDGDLGAHGVLEAPPPGAL